jgi:hypothetical protein
MAKGKSQPGGASVVGGPKSAGGKAKPNVGGAKMGGPKKGGKK